MSISPYCPNQLWGPPNPYPVGTGSSFPGHMVRIEVEISANVGGCSVDFGGQCRLHPDDQNIQERNLTVWPYVHGELYGRPALNC
jgi:hypothetical protein